ncbi:hypothetical protein NW762_013743 [Fusarium torreyae]|uniref:F-box domain-containing protein n=1 Tax=Fusarium torreyae TaxID=1237075 RepID=A0A9W8VA33_9HYPO|nr:hypothetical protein NW762_013743 [Fusarium torreyae]
MAYTIDRLAPEVLIMILSNLLPQDILSIRKTCRPLQALTEGPFFRHWVDTRHLIIENESLRKFEHISESPNLNFASSMRKLKIHTFYLPPTEDLSHTLEEFAADYLAISEMEDLESNTDTSYTSSSLLQCNNKNCLDDKYYCKH